jgi:gas vesicle protein
MGQTTEELKVQISEQRDTLGRDLDAIGDRVSPSRMAQRRKAAVRERWNSTKDRVMGIADDTSGRASNAASGVGEAVGSLPSRAANVAEGNPLAVGLVAFGAGLVVATLLPETRVEQQVGEKMQPAAEETARQLGAAAQETVEQLKPKAQDAVEQVKASAQDSVENVKQDASNATSQTTTETRNAAASVRSSHD